MIEVHDQLQDLFNKAEFYFANGIQVNQLFLNISSLNSEIQNLSSPYQTKRVHKKLGVEQNAGLDHYLTVTDLPRFDNLTKRALVPDIAKTFNILRWHSPCIIKANILLKRLWEEKIGWDEFVPSIIQQTWSKWRV